MGTSHGGRNKVGSGTTLGRRCSGFRKSLSLCLHRHGGEAHRGWQGRSDPNSGQSQARPPSSCMSQTPMDSFSRPPTPTRIPKAGPGVTDSNAALTRWVSGHRQPLQRGLGFLKDTRQLAWGRASEGRAQCPQTLAGGSLGHTLHPEPGASVPPWVQASVLACSRFPSEGVPPPRAGPPVGRDWAAPGPQGGGARAHGARL